MALICLYTGAFQIWDTDAMLMVNSVRIWDHPLRTGAILEDMDWIVVGSDSGRLFIYETSSYTQLKSIDAHKDFIRKISLHPTLPLLLTCSDDSTIKLWSYEKGFQLIHTFEGHSHFVMDASFHPKDGSKFVSCSLYSTLKIWSIDTKTCLSTLTGHSNGVNSVTFFKSSTNIASGSDDLTVKIWDYSTGKCICTMKGHSKNVNSVKVLNTPPLIVTCSEDGCIKLWNSKTFKLVHSISLQLERVWDAQQKDNKLVVGCDEGIVFLSIGHIAMAGNKIFYSTNEMIYGAKTENVDSTRELSSMDYYPTGISVSPDGKFLAIQNENEYTVYSSLGFRNKFSGEGCDFSFVSSTEWIVRNKEEVVFIKITLLQNPSRLAI